ITKLDSFAMLSCFWKRRKHCEALNITIAAALWSLWRLRNDFVFQGRRWRSIRCALDLLGATIRQWKILCSEAQGALLLRCLRLLDHRRGELIRIA
uniref:Reverse transcriptase zinc-binding domain-containing protein n=1 Tax=Aegilops tauschii subsp. strangulata TaxID=200361 RepID=A0A453C7W7_AEGTS